VQDYGGTKLPGSYRTEVSTPSFLVPGRTRRVYAAMTRHRGNLLQSRAGCAILAARKAFN